MKITIWPDSARGGTDGIEELRSKFLAVLLSHLCRLGPVIRRENLERVEILRSLLAFLYNAAPSSYMATIRPFVGFFVIISWS